MEKLRLLLIGAFAVVAALVVSGGEGKTTQAQDFPAAIDLPAGWLPEGVTTGRGPVIYSGSRRHGAIYAANPLTGSGKVVVPPQEGRIAVGLSYDARTNYIFVAGGPAGDAYVYDATWGDPIAAYDFTMAPTFVNDVVVTRDAAYFTDSMRPHIYRLPLGPGGRLPDPDNFQAIPLTGDYVHQPGFNLNGIDATPDGSALIVVQSSTGLLFKVDPETGHATRIDLGGYLVTAGDGILLEGRTLYVVRNQLNMIAEIELSHDLFRGRLVQEITNADLTPPAAFDIPTTVTRFGNALYAVNARFTSGMAPTLTYTIVRVEP